MNYLESLPKDKLSYLKEKYPNEVKRYQKFWEIHKKERSKSSMFDLTRSAMNLSILLGHKIYLG